MYIIHLQKNTPAGNPARVPSSKSFNHSIIQSSIISIILFFPPLPKYTHQISHNQAPAGSDDIAEQRHHDTNWYEGI